MDLVPAIILVGLATVLFWILRTFSDNSTRRKLAETRAAIHRDLVNRFSSTEELVAYLGTDAGRELFAAPQLEGTPSPVKRILAAVQTGIILVMVGSACLALNGMRGSAPTAAPASPSSARWRSRSAPASCSRPAPRGRSRGAGASSSRSGSARRSAPRAPRTRPGRSA